MSNNHENPSKNISPLELTSELIQFSRIMKPRTVKVGEEEYLIGEYLALRLSNAREEILRNNTKGAYEQISSLDGILYCAGFKSTEDENMFHHLVNLSINLAPTVQKLSEEYEQEVYGLVDNIRYITENMAIMVENPLGEVVDASTWIDEYCNIIEEGIHDSNYKFAYKMVDNIITDLDELSEHKFKGVNNVLKIIEYFKDINALLHFDPQEISNNIPALDFDVRYLGGIFYSSPFGWLTQTADSGFVKGPEDTLYVLPNGIYPGNMIN